MESLNTVSKKRKHDPTNKGVIIPRDTFGNALPFPTPSGKICRLKPEQWEGMWVREALGTLPQEVDCSICGDYFQSKELFPLDRTLMHINIQRQTLNTTLQDTRICRGCKTHCSTCRKIIPQAQKKKFNNMCQPCADEDKLTPKVKHQ